MKDEKRKSNFPFGLMGAKSYIHREPLGVVGMISPWNFPESRICTGMQMTEGISRKMEKGQLNDDRHHSLLYKGVVVLSAAVGHITLASRVVEGPVPLAAALALNHQCRMSG